MSSLRRRQETGNTRPFDAANVFTKHKRIAQTQAQLQQAGHDARVIPHENVLPTILNWLAKAKGANEREGEGDFTSIIAV